MLKEIDGHLKRACEVFIKHLSSQLVVAIKDFLAKVYEIVHILLFDVWFVQHQAEVILEVAAKSGTSADVLLKQQPFAEPGRALCCITNHAYIILNFS